MVLLCVAICLYGVARVAPIAPIDQYGVALPYVCMVLLPYTSMVLLCVAIICLYGVARVAPIHQCGVALRCHAFI